MDRRHSFISTVITAILLTVLVCTPVFAATTYAGDDVKQGLSGIQPGDTLVLPADTTTANLTANWGVRVIFQDYDGTELQNELIKVTDDNPGSTTTPTDDPVREGYTFTGWAPADTNVDTNVYIDGKQVCQITGPGPVIYEAQYAMKPDLKIVNVTEGGVGGNVEVYAGGQMITSSATGTDYTENGNKVRFRPDDGYTYAGSFDVTCWMTPEDIASGSSVKITVSGYATSGGKAITGSSQNTRQDTETTEGTQTQESTEEKEGTQTKEDTESESSSETQTNTVTQTSVSNGTEGVSQQSSQTVSQEPAEQESEQEVQSEDEKSFEDVYGELMRVFPMLSVEEGSVILNFAPDAGTMPARTLVEVKFEKKKEPEGSTPPAEEPEKETETESEPTPPTGGGSSGSGGGSGRTYTGGSTGTVTTEYIPTGEVLSEEAIPTSVLGAGGRRLPQTGTTYVLALMLALAGAILLLIADMSRISKKGIRKIEALILAAAMIAAAVIPCGFASYAAGADIAQLGIESATPSDAKKAAGADESDCCIYPAATPSNAGNASASSESYDELPEASPSEAKKVYTAVVDGVTVTVTADAGVFPDNAELSVEKIEKEADAELDAELEAAVSKERKTDAKTSASFAFDIKMLAGGEEVQPDNTKGEVYVSFAMNQTLNSVDKADIYHIHEEEKAAETVLSAEKLDILSEEEAEKITEAAETALSDAVPSDGALANDLYEDAAAEETETTLPGGETVLTARTDGFSYYVVEFSYDSYTYEIGNRDDAVDDEKVNSAYLSGILKKFGLGDDSIAAVADAATDDTEDAIAVVKDSEYDPLSWYIQLKKSFDGEKTLTVTLASGQSYEIKIKCDAGLTYNMEYRPGTADTVELPDADTGKGGEDYIVSDKEPVRNGYEFIDWTLHWNEYYTVYYLEKGTGRQLAEPKLVSGVETGSSVNESAVTIDGYKLAGDADKSITISEGDSNTIVFLYECELFKKTATAVAAGDKNTERQFIIDIRYKQSQAMDTAKITDVIYDEFVFVKTEYMSQAGEVTTRENADGTTTVTYSCENVKAGKELHLRFRIEARADFVGGNNILTNEGTPSIEWTHIVRDIDGNPTSTVNTFSVSGTDTPEVNVPVNFGTGDGCSIELYVGDTVDLATLDALRIIEPLYRAAQKYDQTNGMISFEWELPDGTRVPVPKTVHITCGANDSDFLYEDDLTQDFTADEAKTYVGKLHVTFTPDTVIDYGNFANAETAEPVSPMTGAGSVEVEAALTSYTVKYLDQDDPTIVVAAEKCVDFARIGSTVEERAVEVDPKSYVLDGDDTQTMVLEADGNNNEIIFYYKAVVPYTVRYVDEDYVDIEWYSPDIFTGLLGSHVTRKPIAIRDYVYAETATEKSLDLSRNPEENVIVFRYERRIK